MNWVSKIMWDCDMEAQQIKAQSFSSQKLGIVGDTEQLWRIFLAF
jgi:hypothetical protein